MQEEYNYDIKSFSVYDTYYDLINNLPTDQDKKDLSYAIIHYMFTGEIPKMNNLVLSIFKSLLRPLNTSKKQSKNKTKEEPNENQIETKTEPNDQPKENTTNVVKVIVKDKDKVLVYFKNKELNKIFIEFLELRKKLKAINSERAINNLVKKLNNYDDTIKYKMIEKSITNSWKDVYELKKDEIDNTPNWFKGELKTEERIYTDEELREREAIIGGYYKPQ